MGTFCCCEDCLIGEDDFTNAVRDTGWKSPASTATGVSGDGAWSDHANATASDDTYATSSVDGDSPSEYLQAFNFSFGVPSGATVVGVEVRVHHKASAANDVVDSGLYLHNNGDVSLSGWSLGLPFSYWGTAEEAVTYGSSGTLWGWTLTPAVVNASSFGMAMQAKGKTNGTYRTASVDHIEMKVYYYGPGSGPGPGWTEESGSWWITPDDGTGGTGTGLALATTDDNAAVRYDTAHPDGVASHIVSALVRGSSGGDCLRLWVAETLYVELELGSGYVPIGYLRLIGPSGTLKEIGVSLVGIGRWYFLQACYHYGDSTSSRAFTGILYYGVNVTARLEDTTVVATGTQVGLATGNMIGTAYFNNFRYEAHLSDDRLQCEECRCPFCDHATEPDEVQIDLDGIVDQTCDACESLNATTYVLPRVAPCTFEETFDIDIGDPIPYGSVCTGYGLRLKAYIDSYHRWVVEVVLIRLSDGWPMVTAVFHSSIAASIDCSAVPTLTRTSVYGGVPCSFSSLTADLIPL